jgi:hypothetical protein
MLAVLHVCAPKDSVNAPLAYSSLLCTVHDLYYNYSIQLDVPQGNKEIRESILVWATETLY